MVPLLKIRYIYVVAAATFSFTIVTECSKTEVTTNDEATCNEDECRSPDATPNHNNGNNTPKDSPNKSNSDYQHDSDQCLYYLAQSTIPHAGLGMFAGRSFNDGELIGRLYGDAAFPTVDQDWHVSSPDSQISKHDGDYHWMLTNYDWSPTDLGMENEAEDVSVTVTGFGAAPNCHFRLLNVHEHTAHYDNVGVDRYTSPGAGASTPFFNRTSTAKGKIKEGTEFFVDYGSNWFLSREGTFDKVPVAESYRSAQSFLSKYGLFLAGGVKEEDLIEGKIFIGNEVQEDLWELIKSFPYATREREALPNSHKDAIRAVYGDIQTVELENSIRDMQYLRDHGKCMDNISPGISKIPHAGRGAFATRFIPKGGLVAPAPIVHIADKAHTNMYDEMIGPNGNLVRNESAVITQQIILNYCFSHPNSTLLLFPYSSNVAYINHHPTEYNTELRWAEDFDFFHHKEWLEKPVEFLEDQWTAGLAMDFVALRDIEPGEEVLINYGKEWQDAWDEHVKNWKPIPKEADFNNLTVWTEKSETNGGSMGYVRAEALNGNVDAPLKTAEEQQTDPYPHSLAVLCRLNLNHEAPYVYAPLTIPFFKREWEASVDMSDDDEIWEKCIISHRYEKILQDVKDNKDEDDDEDEEEEDEEEVGDDGHRYFYTVEVEIQKQQDDGIVVNESHVITNVPWRAIVFENKRYTSDIFLKNAFRHTMGLPEGMFPKGWMNLIPAEDRL